MSLIEGVGDEVTQFFTIVIALIIIYVAWWTTSTREQPIRIFVFNGRHRNYSRLSSHVQTASIMEGSRAEEVTSNDPPAETVTDPPPVTFTEPPEEEQTPTNSDNNIENKPDNSSNNDEPSEIVRIMDQNVDVVRQRRVEKFENKSDELPNTSESVTVTEDNEVNPEKITIKLKFLNDDLKPVDGSLGEVLSAFKRRHFETELSSNKVVRLIFNGQVLQDNVTLADCGLSNNCVVHCLIHQKKPMSQETSNNNHQESVPNRRNTLPRVHVQSNDSNSPARDWDLGNLLFFLICFVLITVWYFRYEYAHLYTVTATVALVVVTGIFAVVVFGLYFPEREHVMPTVVH